MNCIGIVAEEMNHHPDWFNVYNQLKVNLNTHDAQGVTIRDLCLATICEELFIIFNQNHLYLDLLSDTSDLILNQEKILLKLN